MNGLPFEVTLIEAQGLKKASSMDVYAVVSLTGDPHGQKFKSIVDKDCGSHPKWNQTFKFIVDENAARQGLLSLNITLKSDKSFAVDPVIGEILIPIMELMDGYGGNGNELKFVSYGVRVPSGKVKGSLEMNYKFENLTGDTQKGMRDPAMAYPPQGAYPDPSQANAYPAPGGGYGYPAAPYGYPAPAPAPGYDYPEHEKPKKDKKDKKKKKKKKGGIGKAISEGAGFLGGLILGEAMGALGDAVGIEVASD